MYAEVGPDTRGADVRDVAERMIAAGATNCHELELVCILAVIGGTGDRRGDTGTTAGRGICYMNYLVSAAYVT